MYKTTKLSIIKLGTYQVYEYGLDELHNLQGERENYQTRDKVYSTVTENSNNINNGNFICVFECTIVNLATYRQFTNAA